MQSVLQALSVLVIGSIGAYIAWQQWRTAHDRLKLDLFDLLAIMLFTNIGGQALGTLRRFPSPWTVEQIPDGFKVLDASGQSVAYVYGRETKADADIANVLTMDEARRVASNITKLPKLLQADE